MSIHQIHDLEALSCKLREGGRGEEAEMTWWSWTWFKNFRGPSTAMQGVQAHRQAGLSHLFAWKPTSVLTIIGLLTLYN